eukprot:4223074-Pyramimonas_sp.AAC.1
MKFRSTLWFARCVDLGTDGSSSLGSIAIYLPLRMQDMLEVFSEAHNRCVIEEEGDYDDAPTVRRRIGSLSIRMLQLSWDLGSNQAAS